VEDPRYVGSQTAVIPADNPVAVVGGPFAATIDQPRGTWDSRIIFGLVRSFAVADVSGGTFFTHQF
jgi:hypothetical protein